MNGLCECGCGEPVGVYLYTDSRTGAVKGQPRRFVRGHANHLRREVGSATWFLRHVDASDSGCWYWTGGVNALGYGRTAPALGEVGAHRVAYRIFKGPIPTGLHVLHTCDVRNCVNPDHLWLGTHRDNMVDMVRKGRRVQGDLAGEKNGQARLAWPQVAEIRALVAAGSSQRAIAARFGVSPMTVSRIIRKETWR